MLFGLCYKEMKNFNLTISVSYLKTYECEDTLQTLILAGNKDKYRRKASQGENADRTCPCKYIRLGFKAVCEEASLKSA